MNSSWDRRSLRFKRQFQELLILTSLILLTLLSGCASLLPPQEIEIPLSRLQQTVQKNFPFNARYFDLFEVNLSNPVLSLAPASERLVLALDARIQPPLIKTPWQGELLVSGGLRGFGAACCHSDRATAGEHQARYRYRYLHKPARASGYPTGGRSDRRDGLVYLCTRCICYGGQAFRSDRYNDPQEQPRGKLRACQIIIMHSNVQ